jgi:hypothetical protein
MQVDQFFNIFIFEGDYNQHLIEALDIGGQQAFVVPLGEFQQLHPIPKHKVVWCEPSI